MKLMKMSQLSGLLTVLLGSAVNPSFALPTYEVDITYFSDATFTREIGYVVHGCTGAVSRQGSTSRYQARSSEPCNGIQTGEIACYVGTVATTCPANLCDSSLFECQ